MKNPIFKGLCTALITPFTADGIDFDALEKQLDFQISNNTDAILVAGTTGEVNTLEIHEYEALMDFCIKKAAKKIKVIAGIGGNNTLQCCQRAILCQQLGADAIIMTAPYYNKSTQDGLVQHFCYVADRAQLPLITYNVPSRTGIGISAESYERLALHPNIIGVKEASGDISLVGKIRARCGEDFYIWSGNDDNTVPIMALGGIGIISVASNVIPQQVGALAKMCLAGRFAKATAQYCAMADFFEKLFIETNPIPIKKAMQLLGTDSGIMRLPLVEMSEFGTEKLIESMRALNIVP